MIETERLVLRQIDPEKDFEPWAHALADADTVRYLGTPPLNRAQAWRNMAGVIGHWSIRGYGFFSVEDKTTGEWVGRVGPWNPEGWPEPEVGWMISPDHLRKGYGKEAAAASIAYAFDTLGWARVIHVILEGNEASAALARSLGSRRESSQQGLPAITEDRVWIYAQQRP